MRKALGLAALIAVMGLVSPAPVWACGGFFCNSAGPTAQAGEDVVFARESDGTMTVHIRINYAGPADRFSWILPLPALPTDLDVGPVELFDQLDLATRPVFRTSVVTEGTCATPPMCPRPDAGPWWGAADGAVAFGDAGAGVPGPMIYLREEVGPYDAVVLGGGADDVVTWLTDNAFDVAPGSEPMLREYAAAGHIFVAIRLLSDRDAGEIRPLVLRYAEANPCVPLRLTAIATVPDMPIRLYFLGDVRAVPTNYTLLEPDFGDARLFLGGLQYSDYISRLADDAGGRAFVTDYAGVRPSISIERPPLDAAIASLTDPGELIRAMGDAGYRGDARLTPLLRRFLPAPEGTEETSYWNCLGRWGSDAAMCGFTGELDAAAFVAAFDDEVLRPLREAQAMLDRHAHLTRLFTTMSAEEMTLDPTFAYDEGVPQHLSNVHVATIVNECSSAYYAGFMPRRLDLPNGSAFRMSEGERFASADAYCDRTTPGWRETGMVPGEGGRPPAPAPSAGGTCAATPGAARAPGLAGILLAAMALLWRRRPCRRR